MGSRVGYLLEPPAPNHATLIDKDTIKAKASMGIPVLFEELTQRGDEVQCDRQGGQTTLKHGRQIDATRLALSELDAAMFSWSDQIVILAHRAQPILRTQPDDNETTRESSFN